MRRRSFSIGALRRDLHAVSAVEFAFAAPVFIILLLVGFDTTRYVISTRRVEFVASTIAQMTSVSTTGQLAPSSLQFYEDSTMVIFPLVLADSFQRGITWSSDIATTVSEINFTGTSPNYVGKTKWSVGPHLRACNTAMISASDTATPTALTLPVDTFGPGSLIVVDVSFSFRPTLAPSFMSTMPIARSFYLQPRFVTSISYTGAASSTVNQC